MKEIIKDIQCQAATLGRVKLMEVCGGHTNTVIRYGIPDILPDNIRLVSGPGCPVCVTSQHEIDSMIGLAQSGIPIATYGDMLRVPGTGMSLEEAKAKGARIATIFSATEILRLPPEYVFFGIGFETTAPMSAAILQEGRVIYSAHKLIPPAMSALLSGELGIDGFICPGHVSTIIGERPYHSLNVPQVISGFSPDQVLRAISLLLLQLNKGSKEVINDYPEVVTYDGNLKAQSLMQEQFRTVDSEWRGLGIIPRSGLEPVDDDLNAKIIYQDLLAAIPPTHETGCRCGSVLKGIIEPRQCPHFRKSCTPETPKGACAVTSEGACNIAMRYADR